MNFSATKITPDSWIERQPEYAPPEGAIWCSDCGEWIEEPCEHMPECPEPSMTDDQAISLLMLGLSDGFEHWIKESDQNGYQIGGDELGKN